MVWSFSANETASLPSLWTEGPFVGNGMVGALLTVVKGNGGLVLKIEVSRADYWDVRLPGASPV